MDKPYRSVDKPCRSVGKPYYVYVLRCADGTLYTGITTDVRRRLAEHTAGRAARGAKYTAVHTAARVECAWQTDSRSLAQKLEYRIKTLPRAKKERLIAAPDALSAWFADLPDGARYRHVADPVSPPAADGDGSFPVEASRKPSK